VTTDITQAIKGHDAQDPDATVSSDNLRQKSFIEDSVDGTWRLDLEQPIPLDLPAAEQVELLYRHGYFGEANQALANQYGFDTPADIVGFRLEEFMPRDLPTSIPLLMRLANTNYHEQAWESIEQDRHGNKKVFLNNCGGEIGEGMLLRVWGTAQDITRQKQLEEETYLRSAMFEQVPDGCVIVDWPSEKSLYMNEAFTRITGYTAADISGKSLSCLQGSGTNPDTVAKIREALLHEQAFIGEILNYKKDGTPFWNLMRISPIRNTRAEVTHYVGILSDITESKRIQETLNEQRAQLARITRVASMGELSAALAHELNQPLTAILSNAQAAQRFLEKEDPDVGEVRDILKDIVSDDKRAGEVIYRIRQLIKQGSNLLEMLDINQVVNEVSALLSHELVTRQVQLSTRLAPDLPALHGDPVQLQQVILNLIMNASYALQGTDSGKRRIIITTQYQDNQTIEIKVTDSGPGIDEEILDQIFQPFFTTREEGMGMGLAITRTIIEAHGGRLWAENSPDRGAVFRITLPVTP
jgi:PAS domain S-box-containing protein